MTTYTKRNITNVFQLDISQQITDKCEIDKDCIVVVDLTSSSQICKDSSCNQIKGELNYQVSDTMYIKIYLLDQTYTKNLELKGVYFMDNNLVLNITELTKIVSSSAGNIVLAVKLMEPAVDAKIQVQIIIKSQSSGLRRLGQEDVSRIKKNFSLNIYGQTQQTSKNSNIQLEEDISYMYKCMDLFQWFNCNTNSLNKPIQLKNFLFSFVIL
ncbi:hypothetical protein IMG5_161120 [Ichthyophthirius multifiliis]|uniref:Uncharacterized protein n=1 Tax=Ichthyophthirius multifiliis TaxID=5932 RepID=G0R013_ICHMU|nr:hypothetical protein IMG5_161120 [Ichthyophthirius multifiliis]EGR29196.1 hypothetical protein IMG5_161120 [Ichthyophthirius multifiliis]|eukprot:XP_004030432.1 hypothetical protein IMG5_161120 [Ichthyophthirius multifiliis]